MAAPNDGPPLPLREPRGGYKSLSDFIASDKAVCIFRRFDALAVRNLLHIQDELCEVEQQLAALDEADMVSEKYTDLYSLHSRRHDGNEARVNLMVKSAAKLKDYEKALLRRSDLLALPKPPENDVRSLSNWVNTKKPTIEEESHFLDRHEDLTPLGTPAQSRNFLESLLERHCYRLFVTAKHRSNPYAISDPACVHHYSSVTIRRVARSLVSVGAVLFVVGPTFALYFENDPVIRLVLVLVFALAFAIIVALGTTAKYYEIFAVVAAYAAVLAVFTANGQTG